MPRRPGPSDHHRGPSLADALIGAEAVKVATRATSRLRPVAECLGCNWHRIEPDGAAWLAVRAASQRHVRSTGHAVMASVRIAYTYALVKS